MELHYSKMLKWFYNNHPDKMDRFVESVSENQIKSKKALVDAIHRYGLEKSLFHDDNKQMKIEIVGGWFGFPIIQFLHERLGDRIRGIDVYDMDPFACRVVERYAAFFPTDYPIRTFEMDYFEHKEKRRAHLIINTSCEHMPDLISDPYITPENTVLALQSNDMTWEPDHTNCVDSTFELAMNNQLTNCITDETRLMSNRKPYTRFTVIGRWS